MKLTPPKIYLISSSPAPFNTFLPDPTTCHSTSTSNLQHTSTTTCRENLHPNCNSTTLHLNWTWWNLLTCAGRYMPIQNKASVGSTIQPCIQYTIHQNHVPPQWCRQTEWSIAKQANYAESSCCSSQSIGEIESPSNLADLSAKKKKEVSEKGMRLLMWPQQHLYEWQRNGGRRNALGEKERGKAVQGRLSEKLWAAPQPQRRRSSRANTHTHTHTALQICFLITLVIGSQQEGIIYILFLTTPTHCS
jgi:hypothetical protein